MFLRVIGNSRRRRKLLINVLFVFITIGLLVLGAFTIKKKTFVNLDSWEIAQELASNATELAMENGKSNIDFATVLWDVDMELVYINKTIDGPPKRDFLISVNTFIGVDDKRVDRKDSWYVVFFSLVGVLVYFWNVLRFVQWVDRKLESFLDDMEIYETLGDENEFNDFVLDWRNQKMEQKKVEIKSSKSTQYDIKGCWSSLSQRVMKAFLPISPALLYTALYAFCLFVLSCYHTWMRKPNELSDNMRAVTNFVVGLESSILDGKRDVNSYVFVIWGMTCQILFFLTCFRMSEFVMRIYCALVGKEDSVRPAFLNSIQEDDAQPKRVAQPIPEHQKDD
ncbi:hypothetical protein CAEBREN_09026 [Caenorhabditis brenneri]|uniref:Uncharacterized protein n=1 Tax=Caenorhabditis brenneri TaxID=135651 RepID=G0N616_CAEBE|nr:hypothetical protein CAEBREN_09026 [Caenorhabditis brenneri]